MTVTSPDLGRVTLPLSGAGLSAGESVTLGVRPHHLGLSAGQRFSGTVRLVERLGNETIAAIALKSGQEITAALSGDQNVHVGDTLDLGFAPGQASLFGADGLAVSR